MSMAMAASRYRNGAGDVGRADPRFAPPAGTTTYGGSGFERFAGTSGVGVMRFGPGGTIQGDPGLFSFLGKAVRGVTGIVSKLGIPLVSGAAGIASQFLGGAGAGPGMSPMGGGFKGFAPAGMPLMQAGQQIPTPGVVGAMQRFVPGGATGLQGCPSGYGPNKSGYWLKSGQYVEPGTACVRKRRMNPLNPRALSRSMRRIESAKRAASVLGRITIRKKC